MIGYIGLLLFFITQYSGLTGHLYHELLPLYHQRKHLQYLLLLFSRFESYLLGFCVVNSWRGIWILQDVYLIPSQRVLSSWVSHIIGTVMLFLLQHFKSVYAPPLVYFQDQEYSCTRLNCLLSVGADNAPDPWDRDHEDLEASYQDGGEGPDGGMLEVKHLQNGNRSSKSDIEDRERELEDEDRERELVAVTNHH
jgi:hypothetical protein